MSGTSDTEERSARDLGKAHMQGGRFLQAAEALRGAVVKDHTDEMAWRLLGGALASLGENQESVEAFTEARNLAPNSAKSHYNLALALQAAGQEAAARASLEKSLEIDPAYLQARSKLNEMLGIENNEDNDAPERMQAAMPEAPMPAMESRTIGGQTPPVMPDTPQPPATLAGVGFVPPPLNTPPTPPAPMGAEGGHPMPAGLTPVGGGRASDTPHATPPSMQPVGGGQAQQQLNAPSSPNASLAPPPSYSPYIPPPSSGSYAPPPQLGNRGDYSMAPAVNGTTIMTLGIVGMLLCGPCGIAAFIMGTNALKTLDAYPNADQSQRGKANAGRIMGIIAIVLWVIGFIFRMIAIGSGIGKN